MAITKIEIVSVQALELPTGQAHFYLLAHLDDGTYEFSNNMHKTAFLRQTELHLRAPTPWNARFLESARFSPEAT